MIYSIRDSSNFALMHSDINSSKLKKDLEKLSSGNRINRSADDASGLAISEQMRSRIRGLEQGSQNEKDGIGFVQVGDGALTEVHSMLQRMKKLSIQTANGTYDDNARDAIDKEIQSLKKEINRIGDTTAYDSVHVFDNDDPELSVEGRLTDVQLFNGGYDQATGKMTWGGITVRDERFSFDRPPFIQKVAEKDADGNDVKNPDGTTKYLTNADGTFQTEPVMVRVENGKQVFIGGDYDFNLNGTNLHFHCEDGAEVPEVTRTVSLTANASGVNIDGQQIPWSNVKDDDGFPCTGSNIHPGMWTLSYAGATATIYVPEGTDTQQEMIDRINDMHTTGKETYTWKTTLDSVQAEAAIKTEVPTIPVVLSNTLVQKMKQGALYSLIVDRKGIALRDKASGKEINNSRKSWKDLGVDNPDEDLQSYINPPAKGAKGNDIWDSGNHIPAGNSYTYSYTDPDNADSSLSFTLKLSDVTSVDSVINGLNGIDITLDNSHASYKMTSSCTDANVAVFTSYAKLNPTLEDELNLGRDFNVKTGSYDREGVMTTDSDPTTTTDLEDMTIKFNTNANTTGSGITFTSEKGNSLGELTLDVSSKLQNFWQNLKTAVANSAIAGNTPVLEKDLKDVLGANKITTDGYFSEDLKLSDIKDKKMTTSRDIDFNNQNSDKDSLFSAHIDFSGLKNVNQLIGTGFDSTCSTCDNHYSIPFTDGSGTGYNTDPKNGYKYKLENDNNSNYSLSIDINSLAKQMVLPSNLASAIVSIINTSGFDFHYQQYAADGTKLYVMDNRQFLSEEYRQNSTFYTRPYTLGSNQEFNVNFDHTNTNGTDNINLQYRYNFNDLLNIVHAQMTAENTPTGNDTLYVQKTDASNNIYYSQATTAELSDSNVQKYKITYTYDLEDSGSTTTDENAALQAAVKKRIKGALDASTIHLTSEGWTTATMGTISENPNEALRPVFDNNIILENDDNYIQIQHSNFVGDSTKIPRFQMNTASLGIYTTKTDTQEDAQLAVKQLDRAIDRVSSKRAVWGATQNRLEHSMNSNGVSTENVTSALSRIRDMDMAIGTAELAKDQILSQASMAMLAQVNQSKTNAIELLLRQ
ncbi:MAG: flagellin [Lachnospiraceae bacterium]|nr:flagellin [Lachnospiraceae bacterium]